MKKEMDGQKNGSKWWKLCGRQDQTTRPFQALGIFKAYGAPVRILTANISDEEFQRIYRHVNGEGLKGKVIIKIKREQKEEENDEDDEDDDDDGPWQPIAKRLRRR